MVENPGRIDWRIWGNRCQSMAGGVFEALFGSITSTWKTRCRGSGPCIGISWSPGLPQPAATLRVFVEGMT